MNIIRIAIGDWSHDGHGQCDYYLYSTNLTQAEVIEAYNAARESQPSRLDPGESCAEYQESTITRKLYDELIALWPDLVQFIDYVPAGDEEVGLEPRFMSEWYMRFASLGNSEMTHEPLPDPPTIRSNVGYGCFFG